MSRRRARRSPGDFTGQRLRREAAEKANQDAREALATRIAPATPKPVTIPPSPISVSKVNLNLPSTITSQAELSPLGKISKTYENQFRKVSNLIDRRISTSKATAAAFKRGGRPFKTVVNYAISTGGSALKGGFNAITFPVRPVQWKNTANTVSKLLTPLEGESQSAYESRIDQFVAGDLKDPSEQERVKAQLLKAIPSPPGAITDEQRKSAEAYRAAVVDVIASDPVAFIAETAGGLAGGWVAGKIISKLPASIRKITPKSLEQRAFDKLRPLDSIDDAAGAASALGQNPSKLLPTGKWSKINSWVPKQRRGMTTIVVLVDPFSKVVKGVITLAEAQEMTAGIPELLTSMGGLQAIPLVKLDSTVTQDVRDELNRLNAAKIDLIPKSVTRQLDEEDELLAQLLNQGVIVIPEITPTVIEKITQRETQKQAQEQALEQPLLQETVLAAQPVTPPMVLRKKDREKRRTLNLRLFRGAKSMFKVTFFFTKSMSEVKTVEARSFVEAVNKAQRGRKARKKQPRLVDVVKVK